MTRRWNEGQRQAIKAEGDQLLISASAGTGKTAVIIERLLQRLLDPADPMEMDGFLLVTFTNAAAQEMRERLGQRLSEQVDQDPEDAYLVRQHLLLGKAYIGTLHAFCLDLVRQNAAILGLDAQARILNEPEQLLLREQVLDQLLENRYEQVEPKFSYLCDCFSGDKDDRLLKDLVQRVYDFAISQPGFRPWIHEAVARFTENRTLFFLPFLLQQTQEELRRLADYLQSAWEGALPHRPLHPYLPFIEEEKEAALSLAQLDSWEKIQDALAVEPIFKPKLPGVSKKPSEDEAPQALENRIKAHAQVQDLRNKAKEQFKKIKASRLGLTRDKMMQELEQMAPAMDALGQLVLDFHGDYQKLKQEKRVMDFNDLEQWALALLQDAEGMPTEAALQLSRRFQEVLVDEYQDINPMQEALLRALASTSSMFMVGDVKQSIYGFRQAEPRLFLQKYLLYKEGEKGRVITLEENYRSSPWILEGINDVFDSLMTPALSGVDYRRESRLSCGLPRTESQVEDSQESKLEIYVLDAKAEGHKSDQEETEEEEILSRPVEGEAPTGLEAEAVLCGQRILEMMRQPLWDGRRGCWRDPAFRDMVVLLPAVRNVAPVFVETFRKMGIPVYADMGSGYFGAQEVQTLLSFLKVVSNPRQDIPLAALLLSPALGFSPEDLTKIRIHCPQKDLYSALVLTAYNGPMELRRPLRSFLKSLRGYRIQAGREPLETLIRSFFEATGWMVLVGAMPGGAQRQANLRALVEKAREFETHHLKGVYLFLRFLEALEQSRTDLSAASILGEADDVVRIMSIHKSKGLEFPVVILANAGRSFNMQDLMGEVLLHRQYGFAPSVVDLGQRIKYSSALQQAMRFLKEREALAEELRLLYVALTRAQERLVVVGQVQKLEDKAGRWCPGKEADPLEGRCFMDWLTMALMTQNPQDRRWAITVLNHSDLTRQEALLREGTPLGKMLKAQGVGEVPPAMSRRLDWQYPYPQATGLPGKMSVTQAKGRLFPELDEEAHNLWEKREERGIPILKKGRLDARQRGILVHRILSFLERDDLRRLTKSAKQGTLLHVQALLEEMMESLQRKEVISQEEAIEVPLHLLNSFWGTDLAQRMAASEYLEKEASFAMLLPAEKLYPEWFQADQGWKVDPALFSEEILVQGTIDAFFYEGDQVVLLDYKTDRIDPGEEDLLSRRYRGQMKLYTQALESQLQVKVKETWIVALATGQAVLMDFLGEE